MPETNTIQPGALVSTPDGFGTVLAVLADGWYRIALDGEPNLRHDWHPDLVETAAAA